MESITVKADTLEGGVYEFWVGWVRWVFYWSGLVLNGVVFVWNFLGGKGGNGPSEWVCSSICGYRDGVFGFMLSNFSFYISEVS